MNRPPKRYQTRKAALFAAIGLVLLLLIIYSGLQILESTVFQSTQSHGTTAPKKTVIYNDVEYFPRQDITTMLVMGIDEEGPVTDSGSYRNSGEADMIALLVLDQTNETYSILCLNRDTMVDMPVLGVGGTVAGSLYGQLALSHTYGSGLQDSAENTRETVSNLLNGITIDYYVAMNMDAIAILNDGVGGVTVTVTDDFSAVDESIVMGEMTLHGEQALSFVRSRSGVGNQMNLSRMERQKEYMRGLAGALGAKLDESDSFVTDVYEAMEPYMVTDCSLKAANGLLQRCAGYELVEIVSPEGENVRGKEYYEFYLDEEKHMEQVLRLFYAEKE